MASSRMSLVSTASGRHRDLGRGTNRCRGVAMVWPCDGTREGPRNRTCQLPDTRVLVWSVDARRRGVGDGLKYVVGSSGRLACSGVSGVSHRSPSAHRAGRQSSASGQWAVGHVSRDTCVVCHAYDVGCAARARYTDRSDGLRRQTSLVLSKLGRYPPRNQPRKITTNQSSVQPVTTLMFLQSAAELQPCSLVARPRGVCDETREAHLPSRRT